MADVTDIKKNHLEEDGWLRRSILDEPRLSEVLETYRSLGFDVMKVPLENEALEGGCAACLESSDGKFWVVYTRAGMKKRDDLYD